MQVQFPIRWTDKKKLSKDEEITRRALSDADDPFVEIPTEYSYGTIVLDTKDIRNYNDLDDGHCTLRTYQGDSYCINVPFEDLKKIMVELTGQSITLVRKQNVALKPPVRRKKEEPPATSLDFLS